MARRRAGPGAAHDRNPRHGELREARCVSAVDRALGRRPPNRREATAWPSAPGRTVPPCRVSIPLNVAEGSGRSPGSADRARFRGIARGSAMECGAILDVVRLFEIAPEPEWHQAKALLVRVVEMLSKMC